MSYVVASLGTTGAATPQVPRGRPWQRNLTAVGLLAHQRLRQYGAVSGCLAAQTPNPGGMTAVRPRKHRTASSEV